MSDPRRERTVAACYVGGRTCPAFSFESEALRDLMASGQVSQGRCGFGNGDFNMTLFPVRGPLVIEAPMECPLRQGPIRIKGSE